MKELAGKTAFVTGAASGIGLGIATALAQAGAKVMLCDKLMTPIPPAAILFLLQSGIPPLLSCLLLSIQSMVSATNPGVRP